eukprot:TRINITY_DN14836_c0_g1_i1.p2 TRINITY_DN14836_c0_g1~~TRINITY_DN14836_c0_g1_i1.p2  ORF type:complete len:189 (-),score=40.51 TRINITY_DN14836_c0_g1_i1:98-664(-)
MNAKKNIGLALHAVSELKNKLEPARWQKLKLVVAGGYDHRVRENVEHLLELTNLAKELGISDNVEFKTSIPDKELKELLRQCKCVLYTPTNEHFGIVPIEVGWSKRPVIAANSGGPLESIVHGETGYLVPPNKKKFSSCLLELLSDTNLAERMGQAAHEHVKIKFSIEAFERKLANVFYEMLSDKKSI